jgi:REP element-mobilizing transposase RayT
MDDKLRKRTRGRLPHWEKNDAVYFVTFRLADSLPQSILAEIREETELLRSKLREKGELTTNEKRNLRKLTDDRIQQYLDDGIGECHLRDARVAALVRDALSHFNGERYRLHAWCIMPNHVHLMFHIIGEHTLDEVLHSIKSFTGHKANKLLGRTGHFWQREYSDRIVRDAQDFEIKTAYIMNNPAKAGLIDWPWVGYPRDPSEE